MQQVLNNRQSLACVARAFAIFPLLPLMCQAIYEEIEIC
jgi:hypothetical protein